MGEDLSRQLKMPQVKDLLRSADDERRWDNRAVSILL